MYPYPMQYPPYDPWVGERIYLVSDDDEDEKEKKKLKKVKEMKAVRPLTGFDLTSIPQWVLLLGAAAAIWWVTKKKR